MKKVSFKKYPGLCFYAGQNDEGDRAILLSKHPSDSPFEVKDIRLLVALNILPHSFSREEAYKLWQQDGSLQGIENELWEFLLSNELVTQTNQKDAFIKRLSIWGKSGWTKAALYHEGTRDYEFMDMASMNSLWKDNETMSKYAQKASQPSAYQVFKSLERLSLDKLDLKKFKNRYLENLTTYEQVSSKGLSYLFDGVFGKRWSNDNFRYDKEKKILLMEMLKKSYPSGGAKHPTEAFFCNFQGFEIMKGVYHYNVRDNSLDLLTKNTPMDKWIQNLPYLNELQSKKVLGVLCISSLVERSMWRYRDARSWRAIPSEAGHAVQLAKNVVNKLGLNSKVSTKHNNNQISRLLGIDPVKQPVMTNIIIYR